MIDEKLAHVEPPTKITFLDLTTDVLILDAAVILCYSRTSVGALASLMFGLITRLQILESSNVIGRIPITNERKCHALFTQI